MRKSRWQPMIILLILLIRCGAAMAEEAKPWNVRTALTRVNAQGEPMVNENLLKLTQDVRQTVTGEYLRVTIADALFDGKSLIVALEMENLSEDQPVFVPTYETDGSVNWRDGQMLGGADEFIEPGQQLERYMNCEIWEPIEGETMHVGIRYFVLAPMVELAYVQHPDPMEIVDVHNLTQEEEDYIRKRIAAEADRDALIEEGKFVVASSNLDMGYLFNAELAEQYELLGYECTQVDAMIGTGKFELLEELEVAFDLKVTEKIVSFLPNGEPVEKEFEDYTMRVTKANYTTGTMEIVIEMTFTDLDTALRFHEGGRRLIALDEEGLLIWDRIGEMWGYGSREADDGTLIIEHSISHRQLLRLPEYVTVCPALLSSDNRGVYSVSDLMEGIVLPLR